MKSIQTMKLVRSAAAVCCLSTLFGCAGYERNRTYKDMPWVYLHKELPEADRAVEAARQSGKSQQCPTEFKAAEDLKKKAFATYLACFTKEGIAQANEAKAMSDALCPPQPAAVPVAAPVPVPVPPPVVAPAPAPAAVVASAAAPTSKLSVSPGTIVKGRTATLSWTSQNTDACTIQPVVGTVQTNGSTSVKPTENTDYTLTCTGSGGTTSSAAGVIVESSCQNLTLEIEFDFDKAVIKPVFFDELKIVGDLLNKYPLAAAIIAGHTDNVGTNTYNLKLSDRRAAAVNKYIVEKFSIAKGRLTSKGYGESKPIATNETPEGRQLNRRVDAVFTCGAK